MNLYYPWPLSIAASLLSLFVNASAFGAGLADPLPERIETGDIVVAVEPLVRLPRTSDSSANMTNDAHARIQYLVPFGGGDGLMINDTRGVLYVTDTGGRAPVTYLDLRRQNIGFDDSQFPNEMGVASVAIHPQFATPGAPGFGRFYTAYSARADAQQSGFLKHDAASHESVIREWTASDPSANQFAGTSREIFRIGQFAPNHNIGNMAFNPAARPGSKEFGMLYVALGDGGAANDPRDYGQSLASAQSAIIRIKPELEEDTLRGHGAYSVPADNPFVGWGSDIAAEIWAYGLRHAQHFSFDSAGRMFITDIGQNHIEEVNLGIAGANYGWRLREGGFATGFDVEGGMPGEVHARSVARTPDDNFVYPIAQYDHDEGNAVGSGFLYEGEAIAALHGKYVFADIVRGRIFYIDASDPVPGEYQQIRELRLSFDGEERPLADVTSMNNSYAAGKRVDLRLGRDRHGELYMLTKADGWVRKLVPLAQP